MTQQFITMTITITVKIPVPPTPPAPTGAKVPEPGFRVAVLPLDHQLETALYHRLESRRCSECGALFLPGSNRAKYCKECAARVRRRKEAERQRKRYHDSTHLGAEKAL